MSVIQNLKTTRRRRRTRPLQSWSPPRPVVLLFRLGVILAVMLALVAGWVVLNRRTAQEYLYYSDRLKALDQEESALKERVEALQARFEAMKSDSFEIERIAREKHLMMKPGEQVIMFTPPRETPSAAE
ncbi:MAG: hypothetical protein Kow0059_07330 [Candidatus Sumerlaeia bacterium]